MHFAVVNSDAVDFYRLFGIAVNVKDLVMGESSDSVSIDIDMVPLEGKVSRKRPEAIFPFSFLQCTLSSPLPPTYSGAFSDLYLI